MNVIEVNLEKHFKIKEFFNNSQFFGFTGTPILKDNATSNALGKRTTKDLFDEPLHKYVITDAIKDENVLKFSVEYVGRYKRKESASEIDIEVEDIDTKELMEDPKRLEKIVDYIISNHRRKTHDKTFSAMFCVSNVSSLIKYYELFKRKSKEGKHDLKIATIFSFNDNEEDPDANGYIEDDSYDLSKGSSLHSRDKLDEFIEDYNQIFDTKYSTKNTEGFYNYYNDISKKVKDNEIDILLVVNMFLTGFDSKTLNTLYVDKNLKYHGLIQAFSRTNRILNEQKSQGNIVCFRNLKPKTDEAIQLFSNKDAIDVIVMKPYSDYQQKFDEAFEKLKEITPSVDSVNELKSEEEELMFVQAFRELIRLKNVLTSFSDFDWTDLQMQEQDFEDYKSKYLDLHDKVKKTHEKQKVSILEDVDFELELIHRDEINVTYILQLLINLKSKPESDSKSVEIEISNLLNTESTLRSKRDLIEKFIQENLPKIEDPEALKSDFESYWLIEQKNALEKLVKDENLSMERTEKLIESYLFSEKEPIRDEVLALLDGQKPSALQRKTVGERILSKILNFVETFVNGMNS